MNPRQTYDQNFKPVPQKRECTIWLESYRKNIDDEEHKLFCMDCRNTLAQYRGDVVKVLPGLVEHTSSEFPLTVQCSNENCSKRYKIVGYVMLDK